MNFENLSVTFKEILGNPVTVYTFGRSSVKVEKIDEIYFFTYENEDKMKLYESTEEIPELFSIYIKRLYNAFDITGKDIESTIKAIQAWKRRNQKTI